MSDCPVCGPAGEEGPCLAHSAPLLTPPTPDPRERGVNYAAMMAARDENERDAARVADAYLADRGVRWSPGAAQMAADLLALEALRAPAPSEAVALLAAFLEGANIQANICGGDINVDGARSLGAFYARLNTERTHPTLAPSEAVAWMVEFKRPDESDWQKSGPHFSYAEAEQDQTRLLLRHWPAHIIPLYTHPAPARGVTVTEAMVERAMGVECGSTHHEHHPPDCRRCWQAKLTAALTPDAEGGA